MKMFNKKKVLSPGWIFSLHVSSSIWWFCQTNNFIIQPSPRSRERECVYVSVCVCFHYHAVFCISEWAFPIIESFHDTAGRAFHSQYAHQFLTTSWSGFEEVVVPNSVSQLSILLTSTDDGQCKSFPCCLDLVTFVDRKCSWLILWFWRLDQISSKLPFLQLLGPLPRSGWFKDLGHSWYNPRFTNFINVCYTLATHQFHVIRGNGGEELLDGNTATLPWCALAIREGFQAGKFIQIMRWMFEAETVQVATNMHLVMLSCCVSSPSCAGKIVSLPSSKWMNLTESTSTVQWFDVIWCILHFNETYHHPPLPTCFPSPTSSSPNQIQPSQIQPSQQLTASWGASQSGSDVRHPLFLVYW